MLYGCSNDDVAIGGSNTDTRGDENDGGVEALTEELRPVVTEGKKWVFGQFNEDGTPSESFIPNRWVITGDTVVSGYAAKKVELENIKEYSVDDLVSTMVIREDQGNVYLAWGDTDDPVFGEFDKISYTLNPIPGEDLIYCVRGTAVNVLSRGVITLQGKLRRAVKVWSPFTRYSLQPYDYWVEGIGALFSMILVQDPVKPVGPEKTLSRIRLMQCYDGDELIYDYKEFKEDLYVPTEVFSNADQLSEEEYRLKYFPQAILPLW